MKGIKASALILAVASIAFVSCKKDKKGPGNEPQQPEKKIARVEQNGNTSASFTYNADGTLKTMTSNMDQGGLTTFTFTYNAQKKISEVKSSEGYTMKYVYQNNQLRLTENFLDGQKVSENSLEYENGRIKSNTVFTAFPQDGGNVVYLPTFKAVFSYHASGNAQKTSLYILNPMTDELELAQEFVYLQYDNKKSPLASISEVAQVLMFQPLQINNPVVEKVLDKNGTVEESTEHVYTYDGAGYPTTLKTTVTVPGQTPTVINSKFFY